MFKTLSPTGRIFKTLQHSTCQVGGFWFKLEFTGEAFCVFDFASGRMMFTTLSPTARIFMALQSNTCQVGGICFKLEFCGRSFVFST